MQYSIGYLTIEFNKAVHWDPWCSCHKLQEPDSLFCIHQQHCLWQTYKNKCKKPPKQIASYRRAKLVGSSYFPKPLDNDVVGAVAILVLRIRSPVIHIHISKTTHEQLVEDKKASLFTFLEWIWKLQHFRSIENSPQAHSHQRSWSNLVGSTQRIP